MNHLSKAAAAAVFALALVASGCSSSGSDAKADNKVDTTTAKTTASTEAPSKTTTTAAVGPTTTVADEPTTTAGSGSGSTAQEYYDNVLAKIDAIDTSDFCAGVRGFAEVFKALFDFPDDVTGSTTPETADLEAKLESKLKKLETELGKSLPADLRGDWATIAGSSGKTSSEQTPEEKAASERLGAWAKENCNLQTN
mgnify:CR=1 FL=1